MRSTGSRGSARVLVTCRVKPGVSAGREGISAVTDERVEVCVTNQARDGAANTSVRGVISKALRLPISNTTLVQGEKSSHKVIAVYIPAKSTPEEKISFVRSVLVGNIVR